MTGMLELLGQELKEGRKAGGGGEDRQKEKNCSGKTDSMQEKWVL